MNDLIKTVTAKELEVMNKYIIWVGGVGDIHTDHDKAMETYNNWINAGYDDVLIEVLYEEGNNDTSNKKKTITAKESAGERIQATITEKQG